MPQPRSWVVGGDDEVPEVSGPVVVKAPDRQGQKGLTLVTDPAELPAAIETARGCGAERPRRSSRSSSTGPR